MNKFNTIIEKIEEYVKRKIESKIFPLMIICVAIILGFIILGSSFKSGLGNISVLANAQGITVSGTSEKYVTSDRASLSINLLIDNPNLSNEANLKKIIDARDSLIKYLVNHGIDSKEIDVQPTSNIPMCTLRDKNSWDSCLGKKYSEYMLNVNIASDDVMKIKDLSLNINNYINNELGSYFENVSLNINTTQYFYTKLSNIKTEMLNEATKNAFERAEAIARSTGNHAGNVITASQGVFQITSKDSVDTSDYGSYDTSTIDKKITAVTRVSFKVK
ncbi:MAG: SIMPL domain-containing protein [Candidatus Pacebacteria bacterium]|nr:SIMPL domain-containing protein [Candidatus Paceibacterota bacterium]